MHKPKVAVYKFSSCDGCQLSILNLENELLDLVGAVEIAFFLEATSKVIPGPYDVALVEGSISTPHEAERIQAIRNESKFVIALGTCATAGGIQALRNFTETQELAITVYEHPEYLNFLETSTPIAEHVKVDLEIWGCPVNKYQVLEAVAALVQGRQPYLPDYNVCLDCKRNGTVCVVVANGMNCMGPATRTGCGAICPQMGRGCYGCFGPSPRANVTPLIPVLKKNESYPGEAVHFLRYFTGYSPKFREAAETILEGEKA